MDKHKRKIIEEYGFHSDLKKAIPNAAERAEFWEGAKKFFTLFAHFGHQFVDDEANYNLWYTTVPWNGRTVAIYYTFDDKNVKLASAAASAPSGN